LNNAVREYFSTWQKQLNTKPNKAKNQDNKCDQTASRANDADFMEWLGEEIRPPAFNDSNKDDDQQAMSYLNSNPNNFSFNNWR
jgi:hypothetical protein